MIKDCLVSQIKKEWPVGTKVVLDTMEDPYREMPVGLKGEVTGVDDIGTIHVNWENGSSLGVVLPVDRIHKLKEDQ